MAGCHIVGTGKILGVVCMELISIIVPVYNVKEAQLRQCIESILQQEYRDLELILVDDGSENGAGSVCDEYQKKDGRIHVIHQKNQGVSVARNHGIQAAKGDWISFVDGDDWIDKNMLTEVMKNKADSGVDLIVWNLYYNDPDREVIRKNYPRSLCVEAPDQLKEVRLFHLRTIAIRGKELKIPTLNVAACHFYKRSIIEEYRIVFDTSLKQGEDKLFNYQYFMHIKKFLYLNLPLYHYRIHEESTTHSFFEGHVETSTRILKKYSAIEPLIQTDPAFRNTYYIRVLYIAWILIRRYFLKKGGSMSASIREFADMMRTEPYREAMKNIKLSEMEFSMTKIRLTMLKHHMYHLLFLDVMREDRK